MSDIPRYRMTNNLGESDNVNGSWVRYEDHTVAVEAAVFAERERCLVIVENIYGCSLNDRGYLRPDPDGGFLSRSRVEAEIRWVKLK
jgi:hypothetical protein